MLTNCQGYIAMPRNRSGGAPTIYLSSIEGDCWPGFWASHDGGVSWQQTVVMPGLAFYAPAIDPYDEKHLLMAAHGVDQMFESVDGGQSWSLATPPVNGGNTYGLSFIDMNDPASTRNTWLWMSAASTTLGTWRTEDAGKSWQQVETNSHVQGMSQIYQADPQHGIVYMAGIYSKNGDGVFRSGDWGKSWQHIGRSTPEKIVFGTSRFVYALFGGVAGSSVDPSAELVAQPGTGDWTALPTPPEMMAGPTAAAVTSDGKYNIIVTANYQGGVWRYIEPLP
jgi:hypothetical protein